MESVDIIKLCNSYQETLYDNVDKFVDNFGGIIQAATINELETCDVENYQIEVQAANINSSIESLLLLIHELKQFYLLHDADNLRKAVQMDENSNISIDSNNSNNNNMKNDDNDNLKNEMMED